LINRWSLCGDDERGQDAGAAGWRCGAIVRITGLQAASPEGPGMEFLDYLRPATAVRQPAFARTTLRMRI
jgi:hypothetical protein